MILWCRAQRFLTQPHWTGTCVQCSAKKHWLSFLKIQSCVNKLLPDLTCITCYLACTDHSYHRNHWAMLRCTVKHNILLYPYTVWTLWCMLGHHPLQSPHSLSISFEAISFLLLWTPLWRQHKKKNLSDALSWLHCWFALDQLHA